MAKKHHAIPLPVRRSLRELGAGIRDARKRRRLTIAIVAERAGIAVGTLGSVERGEPTVAIGTYATVLFILGLLDPLARVADWRVDTVGNQLEEERLPQRVRMPRRSKTAEWP